MADNISVVVNYQANFYPTEDVGYLQFTRSNGRVFIVVDGRPVGSAPETKFAQAVIRLFPSEDPEHPQWPTTT